MAGVVRSRSELQQLTPAQKRVLQHVAAGLTNQEAPQVLGMQPGTVIGHLLSVGYKFGVTSRAAKVHAALASRQITAPAAETSAPDLTAGELRLLRAVATQSGREQIAVAAKVAPADVNPRVQDLVAKANARNSAHLVGLAHTWGLLEASDR